MLISVIYVLSQADMIVKDDETSKESSDFSVDLKPPIEIKNFLDLHVIGQEQAKKTLAQLLFIIITKE